MDFSWSEDQHNKYERVREFAASLTGGAIARDREGTFPRAMWEACADFGIQSMSVPAEFNSSGETTDLMTAALAMEALGYGCNDNGLLFALAAQMWTVQHPIWKYGSDKQRQRYLPGLTGGQLIGAHAVTEPLSGSDHLSMVTTAEPVDGGYVLNGAKRYISLGPIADLILLFGTVSPKKGRWGVTAFIVETDRDGITRSEPSDKMGMRTVPMGDLQFAECFVPEENRLGPEGAGASISDGALGVERALILASHVGAMQRQLEAAVDFAKSRTQFGQSVGKFQSVSNRIADMRLSLETTRLLLHKVTWMIQQDLPVNLEAAMLKLHISEEFTRSSLDAIRIRGAAGYVTENEVERDLRDAIGGLIYSGTSDIQRVVIARMLGL